MDADRATPYREEDFAFIAEHGFNFVRLPLSYLSWLDVENPLTPLEDALAEIDRAIAFGKQHDIHVCLNFHRAPGYCVAPPGEALDLWNDAEAAEMFAAHWQFFAARYRETPNRNLSFNLVNEPASVDEEGYAPVARQAVAAIRAADANRLIISDGTRWGIHPCPTLADLNIAQSTRGYTPMLVTHYRANWVPTASLWPPPRWPMDLFPRWNQTRLRKRRIDPWKKLEAMNVGVHVGEFGCHNQTPHDVALAWMQDFLELWRAADWGWALWNLRGSFGLLDSQRDDVEYETRGERKLDRKMLELLLAH
jgi:endoglucanase